MKGESESLPYRRAFYNSTVQIPFPISETVKARYVIDEQLLLALLADIVSIAEDTRRIVDTP